MANPVSPMDKPFTAAEASPAAAAQHGPREGPDQLRRAAADFEALLIASMLRHMRESGEGGWLGTGEDQAGATMVEAAEEHLAQCLASQGGLGLARMIAEGLQKAPQAAAAAESDGFLRSTTR